MAQRKPVSCTRLRFEATWADTYKPFLTIKALAPYGRASWQEVGTLSAHRIGSSRSPFYVERVDVDPKFQRCGIGTQLYTLAARAACAKRMKLSSDIVRTAMSDGFWQKQVKKGRARCVSTADPVIAERAEREDVEDWIPRYGRSGCDRYELKSCSIATLGSRSIDKNCRNDKR